MSSAMRTGSLLSFGSNISGSPTIFFAGNVKLVCCLRCEIILLASEGKKINISFLKLSPKLNLNEK